MNFVNFTGLLGKDAVVRKSNNGEFASLRVAVEKERNGNGKFQERTVWVNVLTNRQEVIKNAAYLKKGVRVNITGKIKADKEGNLFVKAEAVGLLFKKEAKKQKPEPEPEPEPEEENEELPESPIPEDLDEPPF